MPLNEMESKYRKSVLSFLNTNFAYNICILSRAIHVAVGKNNMYR